MDPTLEVPGTGQTVGDLQGQGYSDNEIFDFFTSPVSSYGDASQMGPALPAGTSISSATASGSNSSWLSGLTSTIGAIGTSFVNITRAVSSPKAGSVLYDPKTGLPYGIDPKTGQPVASAQASSLFTLGFFALLAILLVRTLRA